MTLPATGCGTLMFSERHGQPPGKVDPNIVILDGVGLLFFLVPGLVAFAVDFASGSIYLPEKVESGDGPFIWDRQGSEPGESQEAEATSGPEGTPE